MTLLECLVAQYQRSYRLDVNLGRNDTHHQLRQSPADDIFHARSEELYVTYNKAVKVQRSLNQQAIQRWKHTVLGGHAGNTYIVAEKGNNRSTRSTSSPPAETAVQNPDIEGSDPKLSSPVILSTEDSSATTGSTTRETSGAELRRFSAGRHNDIKVETKTQE
jgi:hypothetical protein